MRFGLCCEYHWAWYADAWSTYLGWEVLHDHVVRMMCQAGCGYNSSLGGATAYLAGLTVPGCGVTRHQVGLTVPGCGADALPGWPDSARLAQKLAGPRTFCWLL